MFKNILVALESAPDAEQLLTHAAGLAESEDANLTILTAPDEFSWSGFPLPAVGAGELLELARIDAETLLRRSCKQIAGKHPVEAVLADPPIGSAVIRQIRQGRHDLVVIGLPGAGRLRAALPGGAANHILHHSTIPVMVVRAKRSGGRNNGRTLAATPLGA